MTVSEIVAWEVANLPALAIPVALVIGAVSGVCRFIRAIREDRAYAAGARAGRRWLAERLAEDDGT